MACCLGLALGVVWSQELAAQAKPTGLNLPPAAGDANAAVGNPQLRAEYDAAFKESLAKPADPQVLVKFADVAVRFGDIEGAISALERLLLIDGDQPEVKLELGVLYFRLGSNEAARTYLEEARASPQASPDTKAQADKYLKEGVH